MLADARAATWALAALQVAVERGVLAAVANGVHDPARIAVETDLDPVVLRRLVDVLVSHDVLFNEGDALRLTDEGVALANRGADVALDAVATFGQAHAFVEDARRGDLSGGWVHADLEVIRAQARMSERTMASALPFMLRAIPELERLGRPGARFLEVGLGAAGSAIALCKRFSGLHVVGLEPLPAARLEARAAIATAGLDTRIEVRAQRAEELDERHVYDAAYVASMFLDDEALATGLARVRAALVPGGLVLLGGWNRPADRRVAATSALRWQLWGGGVRTSAEARRIAEAAGFVDVREGPPSGDLVPLFGKAG